MTEDDTGSAERAGIDRRSALKRAALAAGVVAWTTPAVIAATPGIAHAGVRATNCAPRTTFTLFNTRANCSGIPGGKGDTSPSCCDAQTYILITATDCGARCDEEGTATVIVTASNTLPRPTCGLFFDVGNCSLAGTVTFLVTVTQECADGVTYVCNYSVDFGSAANCPVSLPGTPTLLECTEVVPPPP